MYLLKVGVLPTFPYMNTISIVLHRTVHHPGSRPTSTRTNVPVAVTQSGRNVKERGMRRDPLLIVSRPSPT